MKVARNYKKKINYTPSNAHKSTTAATTVKNSKMKNPKIGSVGYRRYTNIMKISLFLFALATLVHGTFVTIHIRDIGVAGIMFFNANLMYLIIGATSMITFFVGGMAQVKIITPFKIADVADVGGYGTVTVSIILGVITVLLIQVIFGTMARYIKYTVYDIEYYFFYVSVGITEEMLCRLFLLNLFEYNIGKMNEKAAPHIAVIISGTIFGALHFFVYGNNPIIMLSVVVGGIALGYMYILTDNILVPMMAHMTNNLLGAVLNPPQTIIESFYNGGSSIVQIITMLILYLVVFLTIFVSRKISDKNKIDEIEESNFQLNEKLKKIIKIIFLSAILIIIIMIGLSYGLIENINWFGI